MGRFEGKVALVTGGARGQGRSHALAFAEEGADVVVVDLCRQVGTVRYPMATAEDLEETRRAVEELGRRAVAVEADVRDPKAMVDAVARATEAFGRIDAVVANAGILANTGDEGRDVQAWRDSVDTMLSGVFFTVQAALPPMLDRGEGGSIVITSSVAGLRPYAHGLDRLTPGELGYGAAKHGVVGLMRNYALALGEHGIRVNTVHPMGVRTPMVENPFMDELRETAPTGWGANVMGTPILEPRSITDAVLWLCSDEARYVTGVTLPVDAGTMLL